MSEHVRVCVECGEEYRPEVARCADCGGALEDRYEGEDSQLRPAPGSAARVEEGMAARGVASAGDVRHLVPAAEALRAVGIQCRIAEVEPAARGNKQLFVLVVREVDQQAALAALEPVAETHGGISLVEPGHPSPTDAPPGQAECPACGTGIEAGALECPECGLALGGEPPD